MDILWHISVKDIEISTTYSHPFYVVGKGWLEARDLEVGDLLKQANGELTEVKALEVEELESPVKVYNFEVVDWHTYYVSEYDVWVHNKGTNTCAEALEAVSEGTGKFNWDLIKATQSVIEGTNVPRSFVVKDLLVNGNEVWVGGNATKHIGEFITSANKSGGGLLSESEIMKSFMNAAKEAAQQTLKMGDNRLFVGGWEIEINGETGVIYHALMK